MSGTLLRPNLVVEGAFSTTVTGDRIWNDLTSYVDLDGQILDIQQRRSTLFVERSPGTLAFQLDNSGGEFTKENISSPFYPGVSQNTPLRVRVQYPISANLLTGAQSRTDDPNAWTATMGSLAVYGSSLAFDWEDGTLQGWGSFVPTSGVVAVTNGTTWASSGTHNLTGTVTTIPGGGSWELVYSTPVGSVMQNDLVSLSAVVHAPQALTAVSIGVDWKTAGGSVISSSASSVSSMTSGQDKLFTLTNATAPATASFFTMWVREAANSIVGTAIRTDDVSYSIAAPTPLLKWSTGVLDQTGVHVAIGATPYGEASDQPIYCKPGDPVSANILLKIPTGTMSASLRLQWLDVNGLQVSEVASSTVALSTSFQTLSITNAIAPANTKSVRMAIANETLVSPAVRAITYDGGNDVTANYTKSVQIQVPSTAAPGDFAIIWRRSDFPSVNFDNIPGWTWTGTTYTDARGRTRLDTKILAESDIGKTLTVSWQSKNRCYVSITTYNGVDQTTPIHQNNGVVDATFHAAHTTPNVTTTVAGCWIVSAVFDTSSTTSAWSPPGGESVRQFGYGMKGGAVSGIITDDNVGHVAGTYGSKVYTSNVSTKYSTCHTLALKPTTVGTGPGSIDIVMDNPMLVKAASLPSFVTAGDWASLITVYADSWTQDWENDRPKMVVVGTDRSKLIANLNVSSAVEESIKQNAPIAYYKLDETGGSGTDVTEAADSSGFSQPSMLAQQVGAVADGQISWGNGIGPGVDGMAAMQLVPTSVSQGVYLQSNLTMPMGDCPDVAAVFCHAAPAGYALTTEVTALKITSPHMYSRMYLEFYGHAGAGAYFGVKYRDWGDGTQNDVVAQVSGNFLDGATHCFAATVSVHNGNIVLNLYIDGILKATGTLAAARAYVPRMKTVVLGDAGFTAPFRILAGTYSHLAIYNAQLDPSDITDIFNSATTAFAGDLVPDRIARILTWLNQAGSNIDDSAVVVDRHLPDEVTVQAALQLVAATDGGTTFIDGDDNISFISAATKESTATPTLTLAGNALGTSPLSVVDDAILINDITINRKGANTSQHLTDQASIDQHQIHDRAIDTLLTDDAEAREMAGYFLSFYAQPYTRFDSIDIEALLNQDWTNLLACEMWQIIRLTNLPATAPASTLDMFIEGRQWQISADSWLLSFDVSFVIPFAVVGDAVRDIMGTIRVAR